MVDHVHVQDVDVDPLVGVKEVVGGLEGIFEPLVEFWNEENPTRIVGLDRLLDNIS